MTKRPLTPGKGPAGQRAGKVPAREQAHIDLRRIRADQLDLAGATIREIADTLEVATATVMKDLQIVREARAHEFRAVRDAAMETELARLERLRSRWVTSGEGGNVQAAQILLAIHDRKARLLGLGDPSVRVELAPSNVSPRQTLERRLAAIESRTVDTNGKVKAS